MEWMNCQFAIVPISAQSPQWRSWQSWPTVVLPSVECLLACLAPFHQGQHMSVRPPLPITILTILWNKVCPPPLQKTIIGFRHPEVRMTFGQIRYLDKQYFIKQGQLILCTSVKLGRWPPDGSDVCIKVRKNPTEDCLKPKKSSCCGCSTTVCSTGFN